MKFLICLMAFSGFASKPIDWRSFVGIKMTKESKDLSHNNFIFLIKSHLVGFPL